MRRFRLWSAAAIIFWWASPMLAHLNSPHIFVEENAGPYPAIVIVRMPSAVPGSAEVQVMLKDPNAADKVEVWVREIPPEGERESPGWSRATAVDRNFFSKPEPLMVLGLWHMQVRIKGSRGEGTIEVPVSARLAAPRAMQTNVAVMLISLLGLLYSSGYSLLVGLGRDAHRTVDNQIARADIRKGRLYAATGLTLLSGYMGILAYVWYLAHLNTRGASAPPLVSELISLNPPVVQGKSLSMEIRINDSDGQPLSDLQPDHGKMMHMVVVDVPRATHFFHLHPRKIGFGRFAFDFLPPAAGRYKVFADVLRSTGEGETVTAKLDVGKGTANGSAPLLDDPDDSYAAQAPLGALPKDRTAYGVGDGFQVTWKHPTPNSIVKGTFQELTFELSDANGRPLPLEPYMGMDGHLLIMREDGNMFAHVHPMGTLPGRMMLMNDAVAHAPRLQVSFPYGFPDRGMYRLWVQVKYDSRVRTGIFDVRVK